MPSEPTGSASASYRVRRLIYTSTSQIGDDPAELRRLMEHVRAFNGRVGITGMLWFNGVRFVQVLEGGHVDIEETIGRIRADTRHSNINIIVDRKVGSRMFGNWAMRDADDGVDCTEETAFLVGYAARESAEQAREVGKIISASGG